MKCIKSISTKRLKQSQQPVFIKKRKLLLRFGSLQFRGTFGDESGRLVLLPVSKFLRSGADHVTSFNSLVHVESYEAGLVQLLPQSHLQPQVVVDVEAHRVVGAVVVVVRVVLIVWGHEAICAHLHQQRRNKSCRQSSDFGPPVSPPPQPEPVFLESHGWLGKDLHISLTGLSQSEPLIKATHIRHIFMTLLKQPNQSFSLVPY